MDLFFVLVLFLSPLAARLYYMHRNAATFRLSFVAERSRPLAQHLQIADSNPGWFGCTRGFTTHFSPSLYDVMMLRLSPPYEYLSGLLVIIIIKRYSNITHRRRNSHSYFEYYLVKWTLIWKKPPIQKE